MHKLLKSFRTKFLLLAGILILSSFTVYRYVFDKNHILMELILGALEQTHYSPVKIDDAFSEKAYTIYIKSLDHNKKFLLQGDVDQLAKYRRRVDDEIIEGNFELYKASYDIITRRIKEKQAWYKEMLSKPMDYSVEETYETDGDKMKYAQTEAELKNEWRKMLKYQVLSRIDDALTRQEKAKEKSDSLAKTGAVNQATLAILSFDSIEVQARRKTMKANDNYFKFLNKYTVRDRFNSYLNSITGVYDPHTEYFAPKEKKKFDQTMSGQFEGIGARLSQTDDGIIKVSEVMIGSPSFKQGELKAGDEIHKVGQGSAEPVDITHMEMDDAIDLIKGKKGTEVHLTVKKSDGTFKEIPIIRDVIEIEETFAKSVILNNNKSKIGYIYLPSFYTDFTHTGAHKCAADMRREVEKLKKQNVEGIIIDIRDNGGGSLQEVVEMSGLFIGHGPVVQVRGKNNMKNVMEDRNPDVAWDGPLSIMVNRNSASASEILAAAMQDYKRAVIVGTPTFGKGTVQSFINLDQQLLPQFDTIKPLGEVKVTMQKFYRINGGATQLKGVVPDVQLPDPYALLDRGEKELDNPMPWDEIEKANYSAFTSINYDQVKKNSTERVKKSPTFKLIETEAKEIKTRVDDSKYSLKLDSYRAEQKFLREQNKKYEDLRKDIKNFNGELMAEDIDRLKSDTARLARENRWAKNVAKDIYVYEASNVVGDLKPFSIGSVQGK
ncbi:MAG: carboxy terminal-processing peptidase [Bacteroidia bacterium]